MSQQVHHFTLKEPHEIYALSQKIARYFPRPAQVMTGIYELLINAVEHGNLGIGPETKSRLLRDGGWEDEILYRLSLPCYSGRQVDITVVEKADECRLVITDQGAGFNWKEYQHMDADAKIKDLNGRGLLIAFSAGFDVISFNEAGNSVTCVMSTRPRSL